MQEFSFIIATNNQQKLTTCLLLRNKLNIPEGYTTKVYTFEGYSSICSSYNAGLLKAKGNI